MGVHFTERHRHRPDPSHAMGRVLSWFHPGKLKVNRESAESFLVTFHVWLRRRRDPSLTLQIRRTIAEVFTLSHCAVKVEVIFAIRLACPRNARVKRWFGSLFLKGLARKEASA